MRHHFLSLLAALAVGVTLSPAVAVEIAPSTGQTLYVPVYSHIRHGNLDGRGKPQVLGLSAMLSIRNTDPGGEIVVTSARYYDTAGRLLREFISAPIRLEAMASTELFVENKDDSGGSGANFVVVWQSDRPISPPVIETVNAYLFGPHSLVFTSPAREIPVREIPAPNQSR